MEIGSSSRKFKLYDQLDLLEYQDKFVIKSLEYPDQGFSICRREGNIEPLSGKIFSYSFFILFFFVAEILSFVWNGFYFLNQDRNYYFLPINDDASSSGNPSKTSIIYGVAGTIRLLAGTYILVYRVESKKFLSCNEALRHSKSQEKRDEAYFMTLLKTVEATPGLYYSYETDITLNLQRRCKLMEGWMSKPIWKQADPRFVWNKHLLEELIEYKRRLANLEGDTANFIETEQLLQLEGFKCSLLQIRGSIPLLWEQIVDLSYKPQLKIINHEQTPQVVEHHFHDLLQRYGETIALDLTDKHGDEGQLSAAYSAEMQKLSNVRYVSFDFHHVCGNSNFDNLQVLYDQISEEFEKQGYFLIDTDGNILGEQKGVIRSNCIDCLDRTNVTQSYLGQKSLNIQLQRLGVLMSTECISMFAEDYGKFRMMWVEQGDEISLEYTGTHALKGDLVRYGKQTVPGLIKDGISAVSRYYLNNFHDGIRQDALDLVSGRYTVSRNNPSRFQLNSFESFSYLPVASALLIGGLTVTTFTIQQVGRNAQQCVSSLVCAGVMALVKANGKQFCSRPRLCGLL
ncbi:hypothetical protein CRYUN_Cryun09bG0007100 [Craigia yunnanensis]